jgi:hypothetical protein
MLSQQQQARAASSGWRRTLCLGLMSRHRCLLPAAAATAAGIGACGWCVWLVRVVGACGWCVWLVLVIMIKQQWSQNKANQQQESLQEGPLLMPASELAWGMWRRADHNLCWQQG